VRKIRRNQGLSRGPAAKRASAESSKGRHPWFLNSTFQIAIISPVLQNKLILRACTTSGRLATEFNSSTAGSQVASKYRDF
jgi:hypothetical protein